MRKSNFVFLFLFALVTSLVSCNNDSVDAVSVDDQNVAIDMLFLASADDSTTTTSSKGKCNLTEIEVTDLSTTITDYISANYANATIDRAGSKGDGTILVAITKEDATHAGLVFDADGAFVSEKTRGSKHGTTIETSELPTAITDYIASNYTDSTIEKAMQDNSDSSYKVILLNVDETYTGLSFDADGNFIEEVTAKGKNGKKMSKKGHKS